MPTPLRWSIPVKASLIVALVLIAGGVFLIVRPPHYASQQNVFKFGGIEATVRREHRLPGWVGGTVLGVGLGVLALGLLKKR